MKKSNIALVLILVLFSCKSIKKDKQQVIIEEVKTEQVVETKKEEEKVVVEVKEEGREEIIEEVLNSYAVFAVNGKEELKPIIKTTKTIERNGEKISIEVKEKAVSNNLNIQKDASFKVDSLDLKKEGEGVEVIKEIVGGLADGILGLTGKVLIGGILLVILIRLIFKKKDANVDKK